MEAQEHGPWRVDCGENTGCTFLEPTVIAPEAGGLQVVFPAIGPGDEPLKRPISAAAVAWDGEASAPTASPLFVGVYEGRTGVYDLATSRDGRRAVFALGSLFGGPGFAAIGEDGVLVGTAHELDLGTECLDVVPTETAAVVSFTSGHSNSEVVWFLRELDAYGNIAFERDLTLPLGTDRGFTGCPTLVEGPAGFVGQWRSLEGQRVLVTVNRDSEETSPPALLELPEGTRGGLIGILGEELLFVGTLADQTNAMMRLGQDGRPGGPTYPLPNWPTLTGSTFEVLGVEGRSWYMTYPSESARIIERVDCP
ncbi:hypothetical protein WME79_15380 [Sorangium sp. So ce726]|uniref:hypothetical protein n=1 Tax=Sorangium sp. So ce726 TaxID=3133319 RepID=UPI003F5ECC45